MINLHKTVRDLPLANLIHKSDVYFDVTLPSFEKDNSLEQTYNMHRGEIYIYLNQIYLYDGKRWYRANIQDIKEIKSLSAHKQILIHFFNFDLVLFCEEYSHLLALRDFLYLSQTNFFTDNYMISEPDVDVMGGGNVI